MPRVIEYLENSYVVFQESVFATAVLHSVVWPLWALSPADACFSFSSDTCIAPSFKTGICLARVPEAGL